MASVHPFDLASDKCYDPNSSPEIYLTEAQVSEVISSLTFSDAKSLAVIKLIDAVEKLQRDKCLGVISQSDKSSATKYLHKDFTSKFHCWAYVTEAYKAFYRHFGVDEE